MLRKLRTLISVWYAYFLEYRAEVLLWALAAVLPLVLMGVWTKAAEGGDFSLSAPEFARYFLCVFLVRQLTIIWVIWEFQEDVVQGRLSFKLLKPIDPSLDYLAQHLGERLTRLPFGLLIVGVFLLIYPQARFVPEAEGLLLGLAASVAAFLLRFLMQYTFALLCFWTERGAAVEELWFVAYLFLSGLIAPLSVFPEAVRSLALLTPFPYLVYFPASLIAGLPVSGGVVQGFAVLGVWFVVFWVLNRWLWRKGLKQFSAMGA
ncbi:MAG: ABC-2 family transporter protein [Meiothermus sp.]|uniref:ABC transporter permease n=1 Tax=Meiothermus sp. TaxID=1955249 RepID=UPI0025E494E7|nr:ABC-2 family transporter protein [Meiothermus sp.]MCS7057323.1 ABC-2 family transporter protein [Meiothermus sp.]MCS7194758.1 ABC-2 family transporter protein [Meiothermus sp.]MDW8091243.1 ABC-2 family transporter protein [Meiothermus sp.]MDW8480362.1 ABC-2 family transporter protein [Meiothermus sp.]